MAERRFPVRLEAKMDIGQVKTAVQRIQAELNKLSLPQDLNNKFSGTFSKLTSEIEKFQSMSTKGIGSAQDFSQLASSGKKIVQMYEQLSSQARGLGNLSNKSLQKLFPPQVLANIEKATQAIERYENAAKGTQAEMSDLVKEIGEAKNKSSQLVKQKEKLEKRATVSDSIFAQLSKDAEEAEKKLKEAQAKLIEFQNQASKKIEEAGSSSLARRSSTYRNLVDKDIPAQEAEVAKLEQAWIRLENKKSKALSQSVKDQSITKLTADIKVAETNVTNLQNRLDTLKISDSQSFQNLIAQLNQISGIDLNPTTATMKEIQQAIANLSASELETLKSSFSKFGAVVEKNREPVQTFSNDIEKTRDKVKKLDQSMSEVDSLKSRINYFFGLTNSVYLLKRAISGALNTVKELDAVMTETAVVTDYSISDMWDKLPEYSKQASALGSSITDLYSATTLYYQQGLKTTAAMGVGIETMKMARVANMDASDATQAMTAALRGFNMEVNELNAQKVNDVYSELAAITAADTAQIATAMGKTASIANSANMEFETTAALLAQIIETTQEAPETAGTAMKTIIARFTEVKQLFGEGMLTGEDEEGEVIDINKIDTALKTVGISLKDFLNGTKGIDDIFLELASKWDTLDLATQRYIATTAAGSRQQSRFIAMMSNYDRTMELVTAANNSAGASQKQFDKTLESLDAKLQQLNNAWKEFLMGLANSDLIKNVIDLLTSFLQAVNKLSTSVAGESGLGKSLLNLVMVFSSLKLGKAVFSGLLGSISEAFSSGGIISGQSFVKSFSQEFNGIGNVIKTTLSKKTWIDTKKIFDAAGMATYTQSLKTVQSNLKLAQMAEDNLTWAQQMGTATQIEKNVAMQANWKVSESVAQASLQVATATGLENVQAQEAVLLNAQGIPLEYAVAAAKDGVTQAMIREAAVTKLGTGATEEQIRAKMKEIVIEQYGASVKQVGILARVKEIAMTKLGIASVLAKTAADRLETLGLQAKTAAMIASLGVIGLIIAAVGLLIFAIIKLVNAAKDKTPEARLKKLEAAAEAAGEAAEQAAESYNNLRTSLQNLDGGYSTLETLTRGTQEWKDKVQELNDQVLKLIEMYPALAPFVTSEGGVLKIDYDKSINGETVSGILEQERIDTLTAQNASYQAKSHVLDQKKANYYLEQEQVYGTPDFGGVITAFKKNAKGEIISRTFLKNETDNLAKLVAQGQIRTAEDANNWLQNIAVPEGYDSISSSIYTERDFQRLRQHGRMLLDNEGIQAGYTDAIANNIVSIANLGDTAAGNFITGMDTNIIKQNYDEVYEQEYQNLKDQTGKSGEATEAMKLAYAQEMSYTYDENSGKFYSGTGADRTELTGITDEVILSGLAAANASENYADTLEGLETTLANRNENQQKILNEVLTNEGQGITQETLKKYGEYDTETGKFKLKDGAIEEIAKEAGFENGLVEMKETFGVTIEEMTQIIEDNFESGGDYLIKQRKNLVTKISKVSKAGKKTFGDSAHLLTNLEEKFGSWIIESLEGAIDSLALSGNEIISSTGFDLFANVALTGNESDVKEVAEFISSINWADPIEAIYQLNNELKTGSNLTKEYAKDILAVEGSYFSAGNQMQHFLKSADYSAMKEDLNQILETNEEITASDINSLAEEYGSLDKLIKNTKTSTTGLAKAFTKISRGEMTINQLTNAVMASLSEFGSLDSMVVELLETLSNFDAGPNENEVAGFIKTAYDTLNDNLSRGAVGNSQNFNYLDFLFGPDWRKGLEGQELVDQMNYLKKILEDNSEDMRASWAKLAKGKDVFGESIIYEDYTGSRPSVVDDGERIHINSIGSMTTNDMVSWIVDAYEVSESYAEMMLADFKNYSADLATELEANDFAEGMEKAYDSLNTVKKAVRTEAIDPTAGPVASYFDGINTTTERFGEVSVHWENFGLIDESEIQALMNLWGKSREEIIEGLEAQGKIKITNFYDKDGILKGTTELLEEIGDIYGKTGEEFSSSFTKTLTETRFHGNSQYGKQVEVEVGTKLDVAALNATLSQVGIPEEAQARITQDVVDSLFAAGEETVYIDTQLSDGSIVTLELQAGDSVSTAISNAEIDLQNEKLASAIANAFTDTEVTVTANQEGLGKLTEDTQGAVDAVDTILVLTADASQVTSIGQASIDGIDTHLNLTASMSPVTVSATGAATGSIVLTAHKKGIINSPDAHDALVSENGPELIQTKDGAYLTGQDGPEVVRINKGDTVYTAEQTKKIFKNHKHNTMPRFAIGYNVDYGYSGGKNTDRNNSSDSEKENKWENPYDKLYNLLRDIDEELRRRERIERAYEKLLRNIDTKAKDLVSNSNKELGQLDKERDLQEQRISGREFQIEKYQQENSNMIKYARSEKDEEGNMVLRIDWDTINAVTDEDQGEAIETYISQLEEWFDDINEAQDAIYEIEDTVQDIYDRGKDEYFDLENRIKEAIETSYQKEIDHLGLINDSINEANSKLIEAMQTAIDKQRQDRENQKTEEDLAEKQRRLLYLQQDTSGANDLEILELQKQIEEGQQSYTDSLIDQKISELQQQNDKAAEQREQQIALAQAQLDYYISSGEIWNEVYELLNEGIDQNGMIIDGSRLMALLQENEEYASMSNLSQLQWAEDLKDLVAEALAYLKVGQSAEALLSTGELKAGDSIEFYHNGQKISGKVDKDGNITTENGQIYEDVYRGYDGKFYSDAGPVIQASQSEQPKPDQEQEPESNQSFGLGDYVRVKSGAKFSNGATFSEAVRKSGVISGKPGAFKILKDSGNGYFYIGRKWASGDVTGKIHKDWLTQYKTGGIADFTGPAWLDGTKSKPELVLNARDTENFIQLKNILASFLGGAQTANSEKSGETVYDIDINVESIGSDYDVERMADTIKRLINEDARYRNNNAINLMR